MYCIDNPAGSLHEGMKRDGVIRDIVKVNALYLFHHERAVDSVNSLDLEGIEAFNGLNSWEEENKQKINQMIRDNPDYLNAILANRVKRHAEGMHYQLNEMNGDMYSPRQIEYIVTAELLEEFKNVLEADRDFAFALINVYVGPDYNLEIRKEVTNFAKERDMPVIIYAPEGRDDEAAKQFEQIKSEWNAECGFVAGDVQWDGVLSVAETMFGFMGEPARDWLYYQPLIMEKFQEFHNRESE